MVDVNVGGLKGLGAAFGIPDGEGGTLYMRQQISLLEGFTAGLFEKSNIYDIYKAEGFKDEDKIVKIEARASAHPPHPHSPPNGVRRLTHSFVFLLSRKTTTTARACAYVVHHQL